MQTLSDAIFQQHGPVLMGEVETWNAADLFGKIRALSSRVAQCRVLAVLADNGPAWVAADLAALAGERVHLPLPAFFSDAQLRHALNSSGTDALLTDQPGRIQALGLGFAARSEWCGLTWMQRDCPAVALPVGTAKISFTSGSTGAPRGVCLSREALLNTALALVERLADVPVERHLSVLPLALLLENVAGVYAPLLRGARLVLPGLARLGWRGMAGFEAAALHAEVERCKPHSLILVPELLKAWLAQAERAPAGMAFVAVGGAKTDAAMIEAARARGWPVYEGYGMTECGSVVSLNLPQAERTGSVGRLLPHVQARIARDGEIHLQCRGFLGYLGSPCNEAAEYASGDLGAFDAAGFLHLQGRRKNLLVTAYGRNVSPEWVEAALTAEPAIAQAAVFGEARPHLVALLVPMPGIDADALAAAVGRANQTLPDYAGIAAWQAVPPFAASGLATGNGRPLRAAIAQHYAVAIDHLFSPQEPCHAVL